MFKRTVTLGGANLAKLLREMRTNRSLSVEQVAEKLGRPLADILKAESGEPDTVSADLLIEYQVHLDYDVVLVASSNPV